MSLLSRCRKDGQASRSTQSYQPGKRLTFPSWVKSQKSQDSARLGWVNIIRDWYQVLGIAGQCLEQIPPLLPRGREERADHGKVSGTSFGAEAAGDLLPQLHHPPVALGQVVGEGPPWVGEKAEHVLLTGAETQQKVVANPSRRTATVPGCGCGGDQRGLRRMERQALGEDSVITSLDAGDQGRLERHAPVARQIGGMAGAAQQALHPARPVLLLDLDQRLEFPQVVRVAQRMQYACQRVVRLPVVMHDDAGDIRQQAAALR